MKPLCLECGLAPIRCKQKCQRCYNRSVYKPRNRVRNAKDRERRAVARRARYLIDRENGYLERCKEYRARKRDGATTSHGPALLPVSVPGWGYAGT
jgi:hypothetical protein